MENIFEHLKPLSGKPTVVSEREDFSVELDGAFNLTKGSYKQRFSFWGKVYKKNNIDGYVIIEDYDIIDENVSIGGTEIDDIRLFRETLTRSGLKSVSESFKFTDTEKKDAFYEQFENSKSLKQIFGSCKVWNALTQDEKAILEIPHIIDNYDTVSNSVKCSYTILDSDGCINGVPTKDELIAHYNRLIKLK